MVNAFSHVQMTNVTVDVPTLPNEQQDGHVSVPVVIGKYFVNTSSYLVPSIVYR